ncbi:MAG: ATP-binding protein, partial [Bacteroidetes bacterium]|nr:ATP-binding protein [Bacteroidota bacterium]
MKKISEDQKSEWKEIWKDDFLKVLCGFANSGGGMLVIGQSDAGKVIGVDLAARLLEEIPNKARDLLGIMVTAVIRRKEGKELVQISVPDYPNAISYRGEY